MAYTAWRGAVEIKINGFPIPVNIALAPRTSGLKLKGFGLLSPDGQPVKQKYVTDDGTWSGTIGEAGRGIDGQLIDPATIKAIGESERTSYAEADSFAPVETIDFTLASSAYSVHPQDEADTRQVGALWNGLRFGKLAYITRIVMRAGSVDKVIVLYADNAGLWAVAMPLPEEVKPTPPMAWEQDDTIGEKFATAIANEYEVRPFDLSEHPSEVRAKRDTLIQQVLAGQPVVVPATPKPDASVPDLMSALEGALPAPKKPAKKSKTKKEKTTA